MLTTAKSLLRVLRKSRFRVREAAVKRRGELCVVLGNGPSLKQDILDYVVAVRAVDTVCVNQFAESTLYEELQPRYYVFADPAYWEARPVEELAQMRVRLFESIRNKTSWPVTVYVPFEGKAALEDALCTNPHIRVVWFNNVALAGAQRVLNPLYALGLGLPPVQNVLVAALFLAIRLGYRDVILLGADHSWHQSLILDDANRVCARDRHFYDPDAELRPFGQGEFTMHTLFTAFSKMFEGYWAIRQYAAHLGTRVYNASSITFIDAFERRTLGLLLPTLIPGGEAAHLLGCNGDNAMADLNASRARRDGNVDEVVRRAAWRP